MKHLTFCQSKASVMKKSKPSLLPSRALSYFSYVCTSLRFQKCVNLVIQLDKIFVLELGLHLLCLLKEINMYLSNIADAT